MNYLVLRAPLPPRLRSGCCALALRSRGLGAGLGIRDVASYVSTNQRYAAWLLSKGSATLRCCALASGSRDPALAFRSPGFRDVANHVSTNQLYAACPAVRTGRELSDSACMIRAISSNK